jgi:putative radical SAM enzyme (TIGR03279 family)
VIQLVQPFPSPLDRHHDWRPGDRVTHVDGKPVEDILDLYYFMPDGDAMTLRIASEDGAAGEVTIQAHALDQIMSCFAAMEFKTCACDCVFCFIDQNPQGMRPSIYVKDEDYRLSFLYGNYITLTSLGKKGRRRILDQKMSPLFVSVHATEPALRAKMLGVKRRMDVVAELRELAEGGIEIHTQIVLCPGWNDGAQLERSIADLYSLRPGVETLAVVPVGLSAHREGLTLLDSVTPEMAAAVIAQVAPWRSRALAEYGEAFVHLSDEFFLLTGVEFPPGSEYDDFAQLDNGIGLTRSLQESWGLALDDLRAAGGLPTRPLTVLTGKLGEMALGQRLRPQLQAPDLPPLEVRAVENRFYGASVTVAGLLSGADIRRELLALPAAPVRDVALPPRMFNSDDLTLDGLDLDAIAAGLPHRLHVPDEEGFIDFWATMG